MNGISTYRVIAGAMLIAAILIGIAIVAGSQTIGYALTSFMPTYLEETVKVSNIQAAVVTIPVLVLMSASLPLIGRLSDRLGRKFVFGLAAGLTKHQLDGKRYTSLFGSVRILAAVPLDVRLR